MEMLDRERERAALSELLAAGRDGRGGALLLRGQAGVGLTALLQHVVACASDMRVAWIGGAESELQLPFAAVHRLCASIPHRLDELPGPQRESLASAFGQAAGGVPDPFLVGLAMLTLLSKAAEERPLLCMIDDAQWLDQASADAITFVARRLDGERMALVFAAHEPVRTGPSFGGIRELDVGGLPRDVASELLGAVVAGPLDSRVRDRLIAEAGGLPLGLIELPAQLTAEQLAGLARLPEVLPAGDRLRKTLLGPLRGMPRETRTLLLLAAAEAEGRTSLLWSAAALLGISADAAGPAEAAGVLSVAQRVSFRHPLSRLAIYEAAPVAERQRIHQALVEAIPPVDPDRRTWHRAGATLAPDECVAAELEGSAARARGRRDHASAAALLERAAEFTADPEKRFRRTLAAAQAALGAGAPGRATALLDRARPQPDDDLQRAQADRLRGAIGLALGQGADRATMLLRAARALESLDTRLARDTYLEALEVAIYTGHLGSGTGLLKAADAARSAPRMADSQVIAADLLLDGLALLMTSGHKSAMPVMRRALESLRGARELRWLALGSLAALEVWDVDALHDLSNRQVDLAREVGGSDRLPHGLDQTSDLDEVVAGRFGTATSPFAETPEGVGAAGGADIVSPAELIASAWRGRSAEARELAEGCMREAFARQLGFHVAVAHHAMAVLELGLGRYEAALSAAREACEEPTLYVVTATLPELIEAAVRTGERELAVSAIARLAERSLPSGTDWALGTLARCRALLEDGARAEKLHRKAIELLRRSRAAPQLARAHLLYGEWLRRERRRREAREQLRTARDMFIFMGAQAFAERARGELTATGEHARRRVTESTANLLTTQEARIAKLVGEGASNAEIAAQLFISPRTVEYHLHKVFRKLDVSSRTQLARVLLEPNGSEPSGDAPD